MQMRTRAGASGASARPRPLLSIAAYAFAAKIASHGRKGLFPRIKQIKVLRLLLPPKNNYSNRQLTATGALAPGNGSLNLARVLFNSSAKPTHTTHN